MIFPSLSCQSQLLDTVSVSYGGLYQTPFPGTETFSRALRSLIFVALLLLCNCEVKVPVPVPALCNIDNDTVAMIFFSLCFCIQTFSTGNSFLHIFTSIS